jgi:hypothetical protein
MREGGEIENDRLKMVGLVKGGSWQGRVET